MLAVPCVVFVCHLVLLLNLTRVNFYSSNCLIMFQYNLFLEFENLQIAYESILTIRFYYSIVFHALVASLYIATFSLVIHPDPDSCTFFANSKSLLPSHPMILKNKITVCMSQRNQNIRLYKYNRL